MRQQYSFTYDWNAEAVFIVDTEKFTTEVAMMTLEFFTWEYEPDWDADPVQEVMKKYALEVIRISTQNSWNKSGVIDYWKNNVEGFAPIDGSYGVELIRVSSYSLDQDSLEMEIKEVES